MDVILNQLVAGLSVGSVLLLVAVGLALTFGQMGVINMAHGEFIMVGAYTAFVVQSVVGSAGMSLFISIPLAFIVGGLFGVLLEQFLLRHLYHRPLDTLLATFGVGLILQQLARNIFGAPAVDVRAPEFLRGNVEILGTLIPTARLFILGLALASVAALAAFLNKSAWGRRIRAVVLNRDLAETTGIDTRATDRMTFFVGSGLAGIAGVAITLIGATGPTIGQNYIVDAFLVVAAGGIGRIKGAVIMAFVLGIMQAFVEYTTSASIAKFIVLIAVVAFLQFRPQGLFKTQTRSLV
ncbi:ABC transporter permease [Corynebacterium deserti GIMN1.010]|uniref:ABC transporter permease n=1 Tax=Corynebacterium deserti GIMN1.010 TaxID=931089 RepID=A0A0M4CF66_9CORY|nr:urea ABC transporter permease subunit UrtB [Corynebacterium deserti]ALC05365.1 ABC transporter permease [Corynebacterium deserti GIMN1.010]